MTSGSLERRLREARYQKAFRACVAILEGVGIDPADRTLIPLDDLESIWPRYLARLRHASADSDHWAAIEQQAVQDRLDHVASAVRDVSVVWLTLVDSEPIGIEVPTGPLLSAGVAYFVSRAGDLMLTSRTGLNGMCVELNHLATGDEYEVAAWGRFAV